MRLPASTLTRSTGGRWVAALALAWPQLACSSSGATGGAADAGAGVAACASPGGPDPGPPDDHCQTAGPDGGVLVTTVDPALCSAVPDEDAGTIACPYLPDRFGQQGDDDDCKYHVTWSSTPVCEEPGSVIFTVQATRRATGAPLTGAQPIAEVFTTTPGDWDASGYCDNASMTPGSAGTFVEGPPGTYVGPIGFPDAGPWTVRFHFFPGCNHGVSSPHGHVTFHLEVP